jgi:hypothetical protein
MIRAKKQLPRDSVRQVRERHEPRELSVGLSCRSTSVAPPGRTLLECRPEPKPDSLPRPCGVRKLGRLLVVRFPGRRGLTACARPSTLFHAEPAAPRGVDLTTIKCDGARSMGTQTNLPHAARPVRRQLAVGGRPAAVRDGLHNGGDCQLRGCRRAALLGGGAGRRDRRRLLLLGNAAALSGEPT